MGYSDIEFHSSESNSESGETSVIRAFPDQTKQNANTPAKVNRPHNNTELNS